eukprot:TRINITY_DN77162_c0_g1_i1.p2 TRINITY_DN77162_c0_g1~~TRINITY_DN77162_c0_g1_i1.p2  ORF type:complete len:137 (+),score=35.12 TRINITY_DN77162_c0_g1_i1:51-413(+)
MGARWVEDELRSIDVDFRQQKMNAFGSSADTVAEHVDELVTFTSSLLLTNSCSAMVSNCSKPAGEDFMCTDMNESKFDEISNEFRNKQKHIEEMTGLMSHMAAKVSTINDCVHAHDLEDE